MERIMKKKILSSLLVFSFLIVICCSLFGCNSYGDKFEFEGNISILNEGNDPNSQFSYIGSNIKLSYMEFPIENQDLVILITAEVLPSCLQDNILLNWAVTTDEEEFDPTTYIPTSDTIVTEHFTMGYNFYPSEENDEEFQLFTGTDICIISFTSPFPNTEYIIWCISRENPQIYDTCKLKYDGAPQLLTYGYVPSYKDDYTVEDDIEEVLYNDVADNFYFSYRHKLGELGSNYTDSIPQIRLDSVESNVSMVFLYSWQNSEHSTTLNAGYIVVPLKDYYSNLISCSLTPTDKLVPVKDVITFNQLLYPGDIKDKSYLSNNYYNGTLKQFMGYIKTPKLSTSVNKPLSTNMFDYISSSEAWIKYNFVDSRLGNFSIKIILAKNV